MPFFWFCPSERLDGGIFLGRAIIACDRNAENAIAIRGVCRAGEESAIAAAYPPPAAAEPAGYGADMGPRRCMACWSMPTRMVPRPRPRVLPTMP